jgi:secreted trypsin-like serine protease
MCHQISTGVDGKCAIAVQPGVYTRVSAFSDWKRTLKDRGFAFPNIESSHIDSSISTKESIEKPLQKRKKKF